VVLNAPFKMKLPETTADSRALSKTGRTSPSKSAMFVTNLKLLDLDKLETWPNMNAESIIQRDQKARIQAVEWSLYQLFFIYDPEETRNVRTLENLC
jgi:hypothetical protein